jgi:hypothetical protein
MIQWRESGAQYREVRHRDKRAGGMPGSAAREPIRESAPAGRRSIAVVVAINLLVLAVYGGPTRINLFVFPGLNGYGSERG